MARQAGALNPGITLQGDWRRSTPPFIVLPYHFPQGAAAMFRILLPFLLLLAAPAVHALGVDELVQKNIDARGGLAALRAMNSLKTSGRLGFSQGDFSIDLGYTAYARRDTRLRTELSMQGLSQVTGYAAGDAWIINPFQGRRDPERISAEDAKDYEIPADLDGPLVDWRSKGHRVEYLGTEDMDGTLAHKLKISLKNGDTQYRYLDPDYFLEILVVDQMTRRGIRREIETELGNYEKVDGVYIPFSQETGPRGQPRSQKLVIEKAEANVAMDDALFAFPQVAK